jgi:hypothetical protein
MADTPKSPWCGAYLEHEAWGPVPLLGGGQKVLLGVNDQRRWIDIHAPHATEHHDVTDIAFRLAHKFPSGVVKAEVSNDGTILSTSKDLKDDRSWVPFYPPRTDFPVHLATVYRGDLTEVGRLGIRFDLATYSPKSGETKEVQFRYYWQVDSVDSWWNEANCVMRIPRHPNILAFDALVVENVGGVDRVVGFTTDHVSAEPFSKNMDQMFKLKHLKQLIDVSVPSNSSFITANMLMPSRLSTTSTSVSASSIVPYRHVTFPSIPRRITFGSSTSFGRQSWAGKDMMRFLDTTRDATTSSSWS